MLKTPHLHFGTAITHGEPHPMADEALTSQTTSALTSTWATCKGLMLGLSLSRVQAAIGTLAGIASITGAAFSLVQFARPANAGDLVAIVQAAGSHRSVPDATIEVLTTQNAIVATLTPDSGGRVTQQLTEGVYVVRVSHPRYAAEVRRVQVLPRQTVEIRASLRAGSSSPIARAVNDGVSAVRRALRF
jgi:Carboxypeptidase regulatory-like domain